MDDSWVVLLDLVSTALSIFMSPSSSTAMKYFYLTNEAFGPGLVLTIPEGSTNLVLAEKNYSLSQTWHWENNLLMSGTGMVLNLENQEGNDLPVLAMDPHGGKNQEFYFQDVNNIFFYITMLTEKTEKTDQPNLLLCATKGKVSMRKGGGLWRKDGSMWRKLQIDQPYTWEPMTSNTVPANALPTGNDGGDIFIGLGAVNGKMECLGKVEDNTRYMVYPRGREVVNVTSEPFFVLSINKDYEAVWEEHKEDHIPELAVGEWIDEHTLFVGRGYIENKIIPGMFLPGRDYLYALHDGSAQKLYNFEVLTVVKKS